MVPQNIENCYLSIHDLFHIWMLQYIQHFFRVELLNPQDCAYSGWTKYTTHANDRISL